MQNGISGIVFFVFIISAYTVLAAPLPAPAPALPWTCSCQGPDEGTLIFPNPTGDCEVTLTPPAGIKQPPATAYYTDVNRVGCYQACLGFAELANPPATSCSYTDWSSKIM